MIPSQGKKRVKGVMVFQEYESKKTRTVEVTVVLINKTLRTVEP